MLIFNVFLSSLEKALLHFIFRKLCQFAADSRVMIYCSSYPFKEPGGYCLPAGGSRYALPGSHQTAWTCFCTGGDSQGNVPHQATFVIVNCNDVGMDTEMYSFIYDLLLT